MEIWKDIKGFEGMYQVSSLGRVRSLDRYVKYYKGLRLKKGKLLKLNTNQSGYHFVMLSKDCKIKNVRVHQLVAMAFLGHKPNGLKIVVNHKNFVRTDNRVENLEIVTMRENTNKKHLPSSSKYVGVCWHKEAKKWTSQIYKNGKQIRLGYFDSEIKASEAYQKALSEINQKSTQTKRSNNS